MTLASPSDTVLLNGRVTTVDDHSRIAEALWISGGRIAAVGDEEDIRTAAPPGAAILDLAGRTAIPGMIDNHTHQLLAGLDAPSSRAKVNIAGATSIAQIQSLIAEAARRMAPGQWIGTSCMFRGALAEGRFPDRYDLDAVAPDNPVYIFQSGKNLIANSLALAAAGIDRHTPDPRDPELSQGHVVRDDSGEPTGHLIAGAGDLARRRWWVAEGQPMKKWDFLHFDEATYNAALRAQMAVFNAAGITATRDMGVSESEIAAYRRLAASGDATVRTELIVGLPIRYVPTGEAEELIRGYPGPKQGEGDHAFWWVGGFKFVLQNDGYWSHPPDKARRLILEANRQGWTPVIHGPAIHQQEAWDGLLEVLAEADRERPLAGRRCSFEHWIGTRRAVHLAQLRDWGVTVAPNPNLSYFAAGRSLRMHEALQRARISRPDAFAPIEHARREWGLRIRDWFDAGLLVSGGTDCPATAYDPARPLLGLYAARTQMSLAGALLPDQVVDAEEALRMWTINGARSMSADDRLGSLEPGKLADITILSGDPLTGDPEALLDILVDETFVSGRSVFRRADEAG